MTMPVPTVFDPSAKAQAGADHWAAVTEAEAYALRVSLSADHGAAFDAAFANSSDYPLSDGSVWRQWLWNGTWYGRRTTVASATIPGTQAFFRWILGRASSEAASAAAQAANYANMGTDAQRIRAAQLRYMAQGMSEQDAASRAYGEFAQGTLAGVPGVGADPPPPPLPPVLPPTTTPATPTNYTVPIVIGVAVVGVGVAAWMMSGRKRHKRRAR